LHFVFGEKRTRLNREFFRAEPDLVKAIIELVAIRTEEVSDAEQEITPEQRDAIETVKKARAEAITFDRLGVAPGAVLKFTKDPEITCTVAGPKKVLFRGAEMSLSAAALIVVKEMGYNWSTLRGSDTWADNAVKRTGMTSKVEVEQ